MSHIDEELAHAIEQSETEPEPVVANRREPTKARPRRNIGLLVGLVVMGGGILALVFTSFESEAIYAKTVDELVAEKASLVNRNVNVTGVLVKGSLKHRADPCEYRFELKEGDTVLPIQYAQCIVPDTFKDVPYMDVSVTATGRLTEAGHFEADQIMAKCPSKYDMKDRSESGETTPHGPIQSTSLAPQPNP